MDRLVICHLSFVTATSNVRAHGRPFSIEMRRVLMISYYYPRPGDVPSRDVSVGSERVRQFARHLPRYGYQPAVLAGGPQPGEKWPGPLWFAPERFRSAAPPAPAAEAQHAGGLSDSLKRLLRPLLFPDRLSLTWTGSAVRWGMELARESASDLVFSSSPPVAAHLAGAAIARRLHVPWIADFRDGFSFEPPDGETRLRGLRARLEGRLVRRAARIIGVTEPITRDFIERFPDQAGKGVTLTNGYDADEIREALSGIGPVAGSPDWTVLYAGTVSISSRDQSLETLVAGFRQAARESSPAPMTLRLVGTFTAAEREMAQTGPGSGRIEICPWRPKREVLGDMALAGLLVVLAGKRLSVATSKLFDYIGVGRPILVVGAGSAAARIVEENGWGRAVVDRPEAIARAILDFHHGRAGQAFAQTPAADMAGRERFSRQALTRELAEVFDGVLARHARQVGEIRNQ